MTTNAICSWDFTIGEEHVTQKDLKEWLKEVSKKWTFQLEKGSISGYSHYQGRLSLKVKARKVEKKWEQIHFSPTSTENSENDFYVSKSETRIEGPWKNTDTEIYIPRQIREIETLMHWQKYVISKSDIWDTRKINIIVDPKGGHGKTILKGYMRAHNLGRPLPFCNDYQSLMRMVMDMPTARCYIIDIPKAINKDRLYQLYAGIESVKDGYAYDDRYSFKEKYFDCPNIWVFTNTVPDLEMLSSDRWNIYHFDEDGKLFFHGGKPVILDEKKIE